MYILLSVDYPLSQKNSALTLAGSNGLVIDLRSHDAEYEMIAFDCTALSVFREEKEILFCGGERMLKIEKIHHEREVKWSGSGYIESLIKFDQILQSTNMMINNSMLTVRDCLEQMKLSNERTCPSLLDYFRSLLSISTSTSV